MLNLNLPPRLGGFNPTETRLRRPAGPGGPRIRVLSAMKQQHEHQVHQGQHRCPGRATEGRDLRVVLSQAGVGRADAVQRRGSRGWIVGTRTSKSRRHTIGDLRIVPITLAEQRASEILSHAKLGRDLLTEEKAASTKPRSRRREKSVGAMAAAYLSEPEVRRRRSFTSKTSATWKCTGGLCTG